VTLLPFTFTHVIRTVGKAALLSLCLLSACTSQTIQIPVLPPSDEGPLGDPARDAQARLLAEAHRAFAQARYPTAVLFFTRFIERAPDSPLAAEARWWLGQAHEQLGDYAAAMQEYRIVAA
jgi:tetratricopeptide (TPR) repeat protein